MGKSKKKDKKSTKKNLNITFVEDAFYRLSVQDCESKIDRLQKHLENLKISDEVIKKQIDSLNYEQVDKAADLTKNLRSLDESIYKYNEDINILTKEFEDIKSKGDATIGDLEDKYKAMHDQLTCEIKLLKAKLQMLHEFHNAENKVNLIIENEKKLLDETNQQYKNAIGKMKFKIQGEKSAMQKEIETKLVSVSLDFTRSSAIRDAAYAQRLIRENIALEKEIEILNSSQQAMEQQLKEHSARCKEIKKTFSSRYQNKRELIFVAQQKTNLIQRITSKYEKLKNAYMESLQYKNQYQDLVQYQLCKHFQQHRMVTQAKKLASRAHILKAECRFLEHKYEYNEKEIARLRDVILSIRKTILDAISVSGNTPQTAMQGLQDITSCLRKTHSTTSSSLRNISEEIEFKEKNSEEMEENTIGSTKLGSNLLQDLLDILERLKVEKSSTTSVETVTPNSFLQQYSDLLAESSDSIRESFKHSIVPKDGTIPQHLEDIQLFKQESKFFIPRERMERCLVFDVEKGSSFYASTSKTETVVEEHDQDEFKDQESSSYDSFSSRTTEDKTPSSPKRVVTVPDEKESKRLELPSGTIIDVEMEEEEEITSLQTENYTSQNAEEADTVKGTTDHDDELSIYMFY